MSDEQRAGVSERLQNAWRGLRSFREDRPQRPLLPAPEAGPLEFSEPTDDEKGRGAYEPYVSPSMRLAAAWSWRSVVVVAAIGVALWLLAKISIIVTPLLIALLLSALLSPINAFLLRHRWPRRLAGASVFLGFLVVVVGLLTLVGQQIIVGFAELWDKVVEGFLAISEWLNSNSFGIDSTAISEQIDSAVAQTTQYVENNAANLAGGAAGAVVSVGTFFTALVITLFATLFLLLDGRRIFSWSIRLLPEPARPRTESALVNGWHTLVQYVRVQIIVAAIDAVGIGLGAYFLQLPLVIPLTLLVFLASFIPIIGAVLTGVIAVLVALVTHDFGTAVIMLIIVLAVQQIESNILQPLIMGKAVSVHPLAVVLAVTVGGSLAGIVGMLFAVPAVAMANTVVKSFAGHDPFAGRKQGRKGDDSEDEPDSDSRRARAARRRSRSQGLEADLSDGSAQAEPALQEDPQTSTAERAERGAVDAGSNGGTASSENGSEDGGLPPSDGRTFPG